MIRGLVKSLFFILFLLCVNSCFALEKIGIITDTLLDMPNYYTAYLRTPEFFAQDIRGALNRKGVNVLPIDSTQQKLIQSGIRQKDLQAFQALQQGYNIEYPLLKKIAHGLGVSKMIVVTMGMDIQRDFLKNTLWNSANIGGFDVVNPTHRVSVYVSFVDVNNELVLWESIYAKNIRNNKMKNLDTTISNNYEGMLRLKEYSKYISPDIAYNVKMKLINPNYVEPPTYITRENVKQYVKDKHNIGVKKELSEIDRKKWDTEKLKNDTIENVKDKSHKTKNGIIIGYEATKSGISKGFSALKTKIKNTSAKIKNKKVKKVKKIDG